MAAPVSKPSYLSKTILGNLIMAVVALAAPGISEYLGGHPDVMVGIFTGMNVALRFFTKDKIQLW